MLELHCHTTFSDGTLTPTELVNTAVAAGVKALAITDHDTLSGWDEAILASQRQVNATAHHLSTTHPEHALEIVPGVELSTVWNERSLHVLGFYPNRAQFTPALNERLEGRKRRAQRMLDKLAALGYPVELPSMGEGMAPGRPHIAKALVEAGYVQSYDEAFDKFLGNDRPAHVEYEKFPSTDGIKLLRDCGAVPVWAHPYLFRGGEVKEVLRSLLPAGLLGIEVYHPSHSPHQVATLEALCQEHGLLKTGGSDYHGPIADAKGDHSPTLNAMHLPLSLLKPIQQAAGVAC